MTDNSESGAAPLMTMLQDNSGSLQLDFGPDDQTGSKQANSSARCSKPHYLEVKLKVSSPKTLMSFPPLYRKNCACATTVSVVDQS